MMISTKIRKLRMNFNLSQVELAKHLGVTKQCFSNWENDNILPSVDMLIKLSKFFNVSTDYLLDLSNQINIDVSGLNDTEIAHIKLLIKDFQNLRAKEKIKV